MNSDVIAASVITLGWLFATFVLIALFSWLERRYQSDIADRWTSCAHIYPRKHRKSQKETSS